MFNLSGGVLPALSFTIPIIIASVGMSILLKNWLAKSALFATIMVMIVASIINISLLFPQDKQPVIALLPLGVSWSVTVDIFKNWQTALLGTGPETYATTFTRLRPSYLNLDKNLWNVRFGESGSFLLTLITTTGLLGGLSFFFIFLRPIATSLKNKKQIIEDPAITFLMLCSASSLFFPLILPIGVTSLALSFVCIIGLTVSFKILGLRGTKDLSISLSSKSEPQESYVDLPDNSDISPVKAVLPWITTVLSITLLSLYWYFSMPAYQASMMIKQASDIINSNAVGSFMKQASAVKLDTFNPNYQTILSQTYQGVANYYLTKENKTEEDKKNAIDAMQRAVDAGRSAAALDPFNVNSYENLANIYQSFIGSADGASDYAVSHYAQSIALDPTNPRLRLQLGILFFNLGDADQAVKLVGQAIELKQDWDTPYYNMSAIYKSKKEYAKALQYIKAGFVYTDTKSEQYPKIQEEIKAIEKLAPAPTAVQTAPIATSSATTK
jgi:hypothetical protein